MRCSTTSHDVVTDALAMSRSDVAVLAKTFHLLGDQSRLKILLRCMHDSVVMGGIVKTFDLPQFLVSHHLWLLRDVRPVRDERQVKYIFYSIADQHVGQVLQDMTVHTSGDKTDDRSGPGTQTSSRLRGAGAYVAD